LAKYNERLTKFKTENSVTIPERVRKELHERTQTTAKIKQQQAANERRREYYMDKEYGLLLCNEPV